ncbi:hypothetical protein LAZ67_2001264, partial [Cordylochernes scorpioides]
MEEQTNPSNDTAEQTIPKQETTLEEEETSPPQDTSADPLTQIADALSKLLVARSPREIDVSPYDGTFEAQSFFDNFDAQADRTELTYTDRLRKLPCYLQGKPLQYFRSLRLDRLYYIEARQRLIDLFPATTEASFARFLAIKMTPQMSLENYYQNKTVMGMKLDLPADILIESLTDGLPVADQRLVATVQPNTIKEWFDLVSRITQCTTSAVNQRQVDKAPHPTYHNPPPRYNSQRPSRVTYPVTPPPSPCKYCNAMHWHSQCVQRFPRDQTRPVYSARPHTTTVPKRGTHTQPKVQPPNHVPQVQAASQDDSASPASSSTHQPTASPFNIDTNDLHTITRKGVTKIIIPETLQHTLMNKVHQEYNHPGISQMTRIITTQYYWKGISKSIEKFVRSCHTCQIIKRPKGKPYGALGQIPPPQQPFDLISIDTIAGFSKYGHSKTYLHVIVDHLTRYAWTFPSKSTSTLTYIQTLKTVLQQGSPKRLLSDRAPAFTSEKFRKFLIMHGIQPLLTTSNNPQANGLIERLNATITGKLRLAYLENPKASWTQLVKRVTQTYNNTPHSVTSFPPTYLMFNVIPPDLRTHLNPYPEIKIAREIANSRTQNKHKKDKETFDKQHRTPHFEENDLVLVKNYRHPDTGKLAPYFTGLYKIIQIISPNVVRIDRPNQPLNRDSDTIHVNKLKYYTEDVLYITPPQPRFVQHPQRLPQDVYFIEFNHLTPDIFEKQLFRIIPPTSSQPFLHLNPNSRQDYHNEGDHNEEGKDCPDRKEPRSKMEEQTNPSNDTAEQTIPKQETTLEEEETSPPQDTSADPLTQIADALSKLLVARSPREIDVSPYDGTFEAQSFFDNFDVQADRTELTYTDRLRKLPCYLQGKPLQYFRSLRLDRLYYIEARQRLIDLFPATTEASFARFLAIKMTPQMSLEDYYQNKTVMGMKLDLPADILIESLTDGLPVADQRLVATVQPNTIKEWFDLVSRITQCATSAVNQRQVDKAPHPTYHNPPPRYNNQRPSRVTYPVTPPPSPCKYCNAMHWHSQCVQRFPRDQTRPVYSARPHTTTVPKRGTHTQPKIQPPSHVPQVQAANPDDSASPASSSTHQPTASPFNIDTNGLHTITRKGVTKIIIPETLQHTLMNKVHQEYNHPGISQMTRIITTQYYWKGISKSIEKFVRSCHTCQIIKRPKGKPYGALGQIPPPQQPFDLISIDTIAGFSKYGHSKTYLHVIVDHLTRYAWTFPSKSTSTLTYIQTLKTVLQQGSPKRLLSDRAPAFTSEKFRKFLIMHGIQPLLTTSNNPQANGLIERLNATITGKLRLAYLENPKASWTQLVKRVTQTYNNTPHSVTSFPPTYLMFNVIPPDLRTHLNPYPEINIAREIASSRTQNKHKKDKETFDKQHRTPHFEENDLVLVKNYRHPDTGKLAPYFTGPHKIIEIISPNVVRIDRPNQPLNRDSDTIHVNKLKYYTEDVLYITPPQPRFVQHPQRLPQDVRSCQQAGEYLLSALRRRSTPVHRLETGSARLPRTLRPDAPKVQNQAVQEDAR